MRQLRGEKEVEGTRKVTARTRRSIWGGVRREKNAPCNFATAAGSGRRREREPDTSRRRGEDIQYGRAELREHG